MPIPKATDLEKGRFVCGSAEDCTWLKSGPAVLGVVGPKGCREWPVGLVLVVF